MGIKRTAIVGMGALGILYGNIITEQLGRYAVTFIGNKERTERYNREGVYCNGKKCDFLMTEPENIKEPFDLVIFAVKWTGLENAIKTAEKAVGKDTIIISMLNGISSEEVIADAFGSEHIVYNVSQGMDATKIGNRLSYSSPGYLCIGITDDSEQNRRNLSKVIDFFERAKVPYHLEEDIRYRMWCKWMVNIGLNQVVMVYEGTYRTMQQEGEARDMVKAAMREVIMVAAAENITITEDDLEKYVAINDSLDPDAMPSMRQDGLLKRPSEVEMFSGTLIKLAEKHGIDVPVNRELYRRVKEIEKNYA